VFLLDRAVRVLRKYRKWPYLTLEKHADFHVWLSIAIKEIRRASATSIR
jgi:hypothetical protein